MAIDMLLTLIRSLARRYFAFFTSLSITGWLA